MNAQQQTEIEAALFRKLLAHLQNYPEVQNIELMNLAYFCRNCFAKWYQSEAAKLGITMDYEQAREVIYAMPFTQYKAKYQTEASPQQLDEFKRSQQLATE